MRELGRLTPEQREQIWKAVVAVLNLPPEERLKLISTEEERRTKLKALFEQAMKDIGPIPDDRRRAFFHKYYEERRTIEQILLKEADERRQKLLAELHERLKKEFATGTVDNQKPPATPQEPPK